MGVAPNASYVDCKIFDNTGTATIIIDQDGAILMANRQTEIMSGYSSEDVVGKMKWMSFVSGRCQYVRQRSGSPFCSAHSRVAEMYPIGASNHT